MLGRLSLGLQNPRGDDEALDFEGAFVDFGDAGVAVVSLDGVFAGAAVVTLNSDGVLFI
jgi:hypothetical protein